MSRKLLQTLGAAATVAASIALSTIPAGAHPSHRRQCVLADYDAWIDIRPCYNYRCLRRVAPGRAFRVLRWDDHHVFVRNWQMRGWIKYYEVYPVHNAYCRAAGI